jgi:hypothetical protein
LPSSTQFNFAVVDISASPLFDEEDCFMALYGKHLHVFEERTQQMVYAGLDGSGMFPLDKPSWLSAMVIPRGNGVATREYAVYPNPDHLDAVRNSWMRPPFRLGNAFES